MLSLIPSVVVLGLVAVAAARLAWRSGAAGLGRETAAASRALALATAVQSLHFAEEWAFGFHIRFPALFGLEPMAEGFFVSFNLVWIVIWIASIRPLHAASKPALFAAWFLAIAAVLNGIAHPLMAWVTGGYFPGLITAPLIGLTGIHLSRRLVAATTAASGPTGTVRA